MENINNNNTMNNSNNCNNSNNTAPAATKTSSERHSDAMSALFKMAARNLREYHGVPSMTAPNLEKTIALLHLHPARLVAQGLAPRKLLQGKQVVGPSTDDITEEEQEGKLSETMVDMAQMNADGDNIINTPEASDEEAEETEEAEEDDDTRQVSDDSDSQDDDQKGDDSLTGGSSKPKRPIHAALLAGGIKLRPRETRPLLQALGVHPHRLVRLGLVDREALRAMTGRRLGGLRQQLRDGVPGHRGGGMGRPHGRSHAPPHALGKRDHAHHAPPGDRNGPPRHRHGGEHHQGECLRGESEEEGVHAHPGPPHGRGHHSPRHFEGPFHGPPGGPGRHGMRKRGGVPPGDVVHGHPHHCAPGPRHFSIDLHSTSEGEDGARAHAAPSGPGRGPRHHHGPRQHGGGKGGRRGPRHGQLHGTCGRGEHVRCGPHGHPAPRHGPGHHGEEHYHLHEEREREEGMPMHTGPPPPPPGPPRGLHAPHRAPMHGHGEGPMQGHHGHHGPGHRGRHGGAGRCGGSGGGWRGGGHRQHERMEHPAHFGPRHRPQLEAY